MRLVKPLGFMVFRDGLEALLPVLGLYADKPNDRANSDIVLVRNFRETCPDVADFDVVLRLLHGVQGEVVR